MLWAGEKGVRGVPGLLVFPVPADVRLFRPKLDVGGGDLIEEPECRDECELDVARAGFALLGLSLRENKPIIAERLLPCAGSGRRIGGVAGPGSVGSTGEISGSFCTGLRPGIAD